MNVNLFQDVEPNRISREFNNISFKILAPGKAGMRESESEEREQLQPLTKKNSLSFVKEQEKERCRQRKTRE